MVVEGNPICCSYIKLQILFVPFLFNGFCFSAKGREENAGSNWTSVLAKFEKPLSWVWFDLQNPTLTLSVKNTYPFQPRSYAPEQK
ncbi:hypothetical protein PHAVU_007G055450 [Phaseolus vulgaris]